MGVRCYYCLEKSGRCYEHGTDDCECNYGHDCKAKDYWLDIEDSNFE